MPLVSVALVVLVLMELGCAGPRAATLDVQDVEPQAIAVNQDPVNQLAGNAVDALLLTVTIDGTSIRLDQATLARVPASAASHGGSEGEYVSAIAFSGGAKVSEAFVADPVLNAEEGVGLVRLTKRQVTIALPAPQPLEAVEVRAPATEATARLDVRAAYAPYCQDQTEPQRFCPRGEMSPNVR